MKATDAAILALVILLWGGSLPVAKIGFEVFPPLLLMTLRFGLVAVALAPFYRMPRERLKDVLLLSVVLGSLHFGCMFYGLQEVEAGTASLLTQVQVPFSAMLAALTRILLPSRGLAGVGALPSARLQAAGGVVHPVRKIPVGTQ